MPRMNILNAVEREAFDSPPVFNSSNASSILTSLQITPIRRWRPQSGLPGWLSTQRRLLQSGEKILLAGRFPRNSTPKIGGLNGAPFLG